MNDKNVNKGHRERLKKRFLATGFDGFQPHEILELLLFYSIPLKDTNEIAHNIINEMGSIYNVFNASYEELIKLNGIKEHSAILIKMIPQLSYYYSNNMDKPLVLDNTNSIKEYFKSLYVSEKEEKIRIAVVNDCLELVSCKVIANGTINTVPINVRKIAECAIYNQCSMVIMSHNHPDCQPTPSTSDISCTRQISHTLSEIGIKLIDHVIVGRNNTAISMRDNGMFTIFE